MRITVIFALLFAAIGALIAPPGQTALYAAGGAGIVIAIALVVLIAFLPTYIAYRRQHPNRLPIFLVNFFLGGTVIGWVIALVWACLALPEPAPVRGFADRVEPTL